MRTIPASHNAPHDSEPVNITIFAYACLQLFIIDKYTYL